MGQDQTLPLPRPRERYWLYSLLFALTLLTATVVGASMQIDFNRNLPFDVERAFAMYTWFWQRPSVLFQGLPFSLTLMTILLAHEFGHYLAAMYHRVDASLPYFLPSPFMGTFGAFIRVRSPIYSKRVLFDIGVSGPLAGFVFLLPALSIGLAFSKVIPGIVHQSSIEFGVPGLQRLLESVIFPGVASGDIYLHPVARAAWVGMFTTALNLLPIGQLDGGHILYAFFPHQHRLVSRIFALLLLPLVKFWVLWPLWGLAMLWLGRYHPMIVDPSDLGNGRRKLGLLAMAIFLLCFILAPVSNPGL
ncbi:MAG TPA: site-2 protease family protein [Bryobacteraceae bacterium]|nr:site-2 protease family protein [Bryobacteraceae bacterium]